MSKPEFQEIKDALAAQLKGVDDEVTITLTKKAGSTACERHFQASSSAAAVNALGILVVDVANELGMPAMHILSVIAAVLAGSDSEE